MKSRFGDPTIKRKGTGKVNFEQFQFSEADFIERTQSARLEDLRAIQKVDDKEIMTHIDTHEDVGELTLE